MAAPHSVTWDRARSLGASAPELSPYQDEPAQMRSGEVGKSGFLRIGFARRGERTAMVDVERRAPLLVQRALYWDRGLPDMACVYIITTSGGVLQGDRYAVEMSLEAGASAHVTTQSATKIQSMDANYAVQAQTLRLAEGAFLEYLPEPTIPFRRSRFLNDTRFEMHPTATLLYAEILVPGRRHHHPEEQFGFDVFSSTTTGHDSAGRETFAEKFVLEPRRRSLRAIGALGSFDIYGSVLLLTPKGFADAIRARVAADLSPEWPVACGASRLPNDAGLVFRILGGEVAPVKAKLREIQAVVRAVVKNATLPPEFLWRC
jgi:urease accessory protein